jgi:hypothetical protein
MPPRGHHVPQAIQPECPRGLAPPCPAPCPRPHRHHVLQSAVIVGVADGVGVEPRQVLLGEYQGGSGWGGPQSPVTAGSSRLQPIGRRESVVGPTPVPRTSGGVDPLGARPERAPTRLPCTYLPYWAALYRAALVLLLVKRAGGRAGASRAPQKRTWLDTHHSSTSAPGPGGAPPTLRSATRAPPPPAHSPTLSCWCSASRWSGALSPMWVRMEGYTTVSSVAECCTTCSLRHVNGGLGMRRVAARSFKGRGRAIAAVHIQQALGPLQPSGRPTTRGLLPARRQQGLMKGRSLAKVGHHTRSGSTPAPLVHVHSSPGPGGVMYPHPLQTHTPLG